jgi:hypothetical protein
MNRRVEILCTLLAFIAIALRAEAQDPDWVRPSTGTVGELRRASADAADTVGEYLDAGHDWLYRHERRLKVFVTNMDLQESSPTDPTLDRSPIRAGLRFVPLSHLDFELGARAKVWPSLFAALRWTLEFAVGGLRVYPFAKGYAESGLGLGASGGITLERWSDRWVVRSASYANCAHNTGATDWAQTFFVGLCTRRHPGAALRPPGHGPRPGLRRGRSVDGVG